MRSAPTGESAASPDARRRRWGLWRWVGLIGLMAGLLLASQIHWALTAVPVGGDEAEPLHEIAADGHDPVAGAAAWDRMLAVLGEHEAMMQAAMEAHVPSGFQFRSGPPGPMAAALSAGATVEQRAAAWPNPPPPAEVAVGFAVSDAALAAFEAGDLVQRIAATPTPVPSIEQLRALHATGGFGQIDTRPAVRMRRIAQSAGAVAWRAFERGDREAGFTALEAMRVAAETADALPLLITALNGVAIREQFLDLADDLVARERLDDQGLARLDELVRALGHGAIRRGLAGERAAIGAMIGGAYDADGRLLVTELPSGPGAGAGATPPGPVRRLANLVGIFAPRRASLERQLDLAFAWPTEPAPEERTPRSTPGMVAEVARGNLPAILVDMMLPSIPRMVELEHAALARSRATRLAIAAARHHAATGAWPATLEAIPLPPDADAADLRTDPVTGGPFQWTPRSEAASPDDAATPFAVRSSGDPDLDVPRPMTWRAARPGGSTR